MAWINAYNMIGLVEGTDPVLKNEFFVLVALYDHLGFISNKKSYYPGADDNAIVVKLLNTSTDIEERTDIEPFWLRGIPAIHVFYRFEISLSQDLKIKPIWLIMSGCRKS